MSVERAARDVARLVTLDLTHDDKPLLDFAREIIDGEPNDRLLALLAITSGSMTALLEHCAQAVGQDAERYRERYLLMLLDTTR